MKAVSASSAGRVLAIATLLILAAEPAAAATRLYVYELPDGSRVITDHLVNNEDYRLVRSGGVSMKLGRLAAAHKPVFSRGDSNAYDALIRAKAREHKMDFALIKAIVHVESSFNPYAVSHRGARGLMQLMPETAEWHGIRELYDPAQNIEAGIRHLKYLQSLFGDKSRLILAAYNAGENAVRRYGGIPPYTETQTYVRKVLLLKQRYGGKA